MLYIYIYLSGCLFYSRGFKLVFYLYQFDSSMEMEMYCSQVLQIRASLNYTVSFMWACYIVRCVFTFIAIQLTKTYCYSYTLFKGLRIKASFMHVISCYALLRPSLSNVLLTEYLRSVSMMSIVKSFI